MNKLGFGFLRLPSAGSDIDYEKVSEMTDVFLERGGRYFDTCYTYLSGKSEEAVKRCLSTRKDRDSFELCDKIPGYMCGSRADFDRYFSEEAARCKVEYFDVLMLHWLNGENYEKAERLGQFEELEKKKRDGYALRTGFSYHDSAALLDRILTEHPEIDVVQIQLNYLDWESAGIQSRLCYETIVRHGMSVIVMEPLKGGTLSVLPKAAEKLLREARPDMSPSEWGLRFAMSPPAVETVLSGMNALSQVEENTKDMTEVTEEDLGILSEVSGIITGNTAVPCTGCRYCESHCPNDIAIPDYFRMYNELKRYPSEDWKILPSMQSLSVLRGAPSDCVACGECARHCPQGIDIPAVLRKIAEETEGR